MCLDVSRHIVKQAPVNDRLKQKNCALFNLIAEFLGFLSAFSARFTPCRCSKQSHFLLTVDTYIYLEGVTVQ